MVDAKFAVAETTSAFSYEKFAVSTMDSNKKKNMLASSNSKEEVVKRQ